MMNQVRRLGGKNEASNNIEYHVTDAENVWEGPRHTSLERRLDYSGDGCSFVPHV